jgi:hypothetical protein
VLIVSPAPAFSAFSAFSAANAENAEQAATGYFRLNKWEYLTIGKRRCEARGTNGRRDQE